MLTRKSIRAALQVWKRTEALGQHPLAGLAIVEARRAAAGYPDTCMGHGAALRDVLRDAIDSLRPTSGPPDFTDDRWRLFLILTEQYIGGQAPGYVAEQLTIAQPTYHHEQARALDCLGAILREQEEAAALIHPSQPVVASESQSLASVDHEALALAPPPPNGQPPPVHHLYVLETRKARPISASLGWLLVALALGIAALGGLAFRQRNAEPRSIVATIPLGQSRSNFIGANPATRRVYVAAADLPAIAVIDAATHTVLTAIPTLGFHIGLAVNPATNRVYVAQQFAGSVRVIDGADNRVLTDLTVPDLVQTVGDLVVNPVTHRLYVLRANNNDVAVFDTDTNAFLGAVAFGPPSAPGCPVVACDSAGIAVDPAANRVYVANPASNRVTVIDGASDKVIATIPVGKAPSRISVNPVTNRVYVSNHADNSVSVIDDASHRVVATVSVKPGPISVAANPTTNRVYVGASEGKASSVIDGATNAVVRSLALDATVSFIALLPGADRAYVSSDSAPSVTVVEDVAPPFVAWLPLEPTGGPPTARGDSANRPAGYDPASNRLVVFGGMRQGGPLLNDTWVLADADGTTGAPQWIQLATLNTPPPRRSHAGAYDAASNRLITYGGCLGGCTPLDNNVHVLSHANGLGGDPIWQQLEPAGEPPPPRNGHSAVYDPGSNRLIVFGGDNCCGQRYNDTWVLTHANGLGGEPAWLPLTPSGELPPARGSHSAVYDAAQNRLIVFGGAGAKADLNDVWVLAGANGAQGTPTWSRLTPVGDLPDARSGHSAVYDPRSGQMLVFGGGHATDLWNDAWILSHANSLGGAPAWTLARPSGILPVARTAASAVHGGPSNRLILFGGDTQSGSLNDTWTLVNAFIAER